MSRLCVTDDDDGFRLHSSLSRATWDNSSYRLLGSSRAILAHPRVSRRPTSFRGPPRGPGQYALVHCVSRMLLVQASSAFTWGMNRGLLATITGSFLLPRACLPRVLIRGARVLGPRQRERESLQARRIRLSQGKTTGRLVRRRHRAASSARLLSSRSPAVPATRRSIHSR